MHGGAAREREVVYIGHKIYYNISLNTNGDSDTIFIYGGRDAGRRPCFHMSIKGAVATLNSLERGDDCFVDRYNNSKAMVEAAFQIAKDKGCTKFYLTYNSFISFPPFRFNLSDIYFLTSGKTWYESILPIKIVGFDESQMAEYRKRAKEMTWKKIADYLISKGVNLDFIDVSYSNSIGSASTVLCTIKSMKNAVSFKFFSENTGSILFISNLPSFHGTTWVY